MKGLSNFQKKHLPAAIRSIWKGRDKALPDNQGKDPLEKDIQEILDLLKPVDYPTSAEIDAERKKYLSLISQSEPKAVSAPLVTRIKQVTGQVFNPGISGRNLIGKEKFAMSSVFVRIVLVTSILFSLTTGAFAFTQNSLPDSPLYDAKLAMENFSLSLMNDPAKIANKHMILAQNRIKEMVQQTQQGDVPDQGTLVRLQQHLAFALHYAAQVQGDDMQPILTQAQTMAMNQIQTLSQVQSQTGGNPDGPLGLAAQLMVRFEYQLSFGLGDPGGFKHQHQDVPDMASMTVEDDGCIPLGDENKYGPNADQPGPGDQYGNPDCEMCEPLGDENKYGQTDNSADTTEMESSGDCIPIGDENKYGPKPSETGPGQPGGNPDCPDCDPEGDKNQYGPQPEQPGDGGSGGNPDCPDCEPEGDENKNQNGKP